MKLAVVGLGVVGSAVYAYFSDTGYTVVGYDKYKPHDTFDTVLDSDIALLCLPTPYDDEQLSYNISSIHETCNKLVAANYKGTVVVKSTVEPGTLDMLADQYPLNFVNNPEFVSAKSAHQDFANQQHIIIGKQAKCSDIAYEKLLNLFVKQFPTAKISQCSSIESEISKLACNCFYATKILYFNEIYMLCMQSNANFNTVREMMIKNGWINPMHTSVPGTDGKLGFGGMCFPKDIQALLQHLRSHNLPHAVLESVVTENAVLRSDS